MDNLFSTDSENFVLGILIKNPDLVYKIKNLEPFMFSSQQNSLIYSTIKDMRDKGLVPEVDLVLQHLENSGNLENAGGSEYIKYLHGLDGISSNLHEYERYVVQSYKTRALLNILGKYNTDIIVKSNIEKTLNNLKNNIEKISTTAFGDDTVYLGDFLPESWKEIVERAENPGIRGKTFGFSNLDIITGGISPGDVNLIAGRPSMGKSAFICNTILQGAKQGNRALIFSLEMNKQTLVERMVAIETGISLSNIRLGNIKQEELDKISEAINNLKDLPIYIDANYFADLDYWENTIRKYKNIYGVDVVYTDYLQLLAERNSDATQELGRISRRAKMLANDLELGQILLSQLNREVERRDDKRPILSDLRQSGNLEEDADLVAFVYRDEVYNSTTKDRGIMEFIIRKHRNGRTGTIFFKFDQEITKITDI